MSILDAPQEPLGKEEAECIYTWKLYILPLDSPKPDTLLLFFFRLPRTTLKCLQFSFMAGKEKEIIIISVVVCSV